MVWPPVLPHSTDIFKYPAMFQFDQPNVSDALARTACTDTAIQMIIQYYREKTISLSAIRAASGVGVDGLHGLTIPGALRALNAFGVTWYRTEIGVDATNVLQKAYVGPVLTGVSYASYPARVGASCGQTNKAVSGGKTDCGFSGAHAILVLGNKSVKDVTGKIIRYDAFTRDPDHHSNGPDFDRIMGSQLHKTIDDLKGTDGWQNTFALYPTKSKKI